jgi:RNA polymerase sigma factor (sigma-70 family)
VAVFDDRASGSYQLDVVVRGTDIAAARDAEIKRDYEALRRPLRAMVQTDFPWLRDFDGLYQEAWTELLELEARGEVVQNRKALLKKIAWRRALDSARDRKVVAVDPAGPLIVDTPDDAPTPDEAAHIRLTAEALRLVIDELDERQAAVLKLRFDAGLSAREIQDRLGVTPKRLEKIVTKAYKQIEQRIGSGGESPWTRRQRSLLLACEIGIASAAQRRRAQAMVERDASCRAMLREMRASLHNVAVALPMPVLPLEHRRILGFDGALSRVDELWLSLRQLPRGVVDRFPFGSPAAEQVAAGGTTIGAGATAKIIAFCIAAGGTATVCVNGAGLLEQHHPHKPKTAVHARAKKARIVEPDRAHVRFVSAPKTPASTTDSTRRAKTTPKRRETSVSSPRSKPPASPAPQGSVELGPGNLGSGSAPRRPAAAPANGGGEFTP